MKHFTFLCIILAFYGSKRVIAQFNSSKEDILMSKMNNLVDIYNEELDKKVQWNILTEAVESIQELFKNYHGKAKENMKELLQENRQAHDQYLFAVAPLFQWCGSVKNDLPRTVAVIERLNLSERARSYVQTRTKNLLLRGINQSKDSISHIEQAIQHMGQLSVLLNVTEIRMNEDFSSNGYYGIERSKLVNEISNQKLASGLIAGVLAAFGLLCTVVLSFVFGPVGFALGLAGTLAVAGIPIGVIHGHTIPTLKQQITIIDEFSRKLEDALIRAKKECRKVDEVLKSELASINQLASDIQTPNPDDVTVPEFSPFFVESLNKLSDSCNKYVESHRSKPSRRRRGAVAEKVPTTPVNHLLNASIISNENYGVTHEIVFANLKEFFSDPLISHVL